MIILWFQNSRS